jgi:hypothetical protein
MPHEDMSDKQWRTVLGLKIRSLVSGLMPAFARVAATTPSACASSSIEQH